jgi:hypothetical protein
MMPLRLLLRGEAGSGGMREEPLMSLYHVPRISRRFSAAEGMATEPVRSTADDTSVSTTRTAPLQTLGQLGHPIQRPVLQTGQEPIGSELNRPHSRIAIIVLGIFLRFIV